MEIKDDMSYYMSGENRGKCVCVNCSEIYPNSVLKCPKCGYSPSTITYKTILYEGVPSNHLDNPPNVKLREIIGVNPNGIENVKEVLTQCDIGNSRQWVRVDCDGVPYAIADKFINQCLVCEIRNEQMSCNAIETHFEEQHPGYAIKYDKLFNSILLVPSTGHTEINLMRALFQICRPVFMELLADKRGFCSKRAVEYIVTCRNHHLSWQIVVIVLYSFALELIKIYVLTFYERQKKNLH
jgi:hypothetical protein